MCTAATMEAAVTAAEQGWTTTSHARRQAQSKGFDTYDLLAAAGAPEVTYAHGPAYPGQYRHIRAGIVTVVDPTARRIITVYVNVTETPIRPDQRV